MRVVIFSALQALFVLQSLSLIARMFAENVMHLTPHICKLPDCFTQCYGVSRIGYSHSLMSFILLLVSEPNSLLLFTRILFYECEGSPELELQLSHISFENHEAVATAVKKISQKFFTSAAFSMYLAV